MKKFTSKKINTIILLVFVYVSVKNLLSFNDSEMGIVQQIDNYNTFLLENQFDEEGVVEDLENRVKELSTEHAYIQKENEDFRLKLKQANSRPFNRFKKSFRRH